MDISRFHHVGIPTSERRPGERHLPEFGMYVSGYEESPFRVEWMRFEADCPLPELVKTVPHVAFEVDDLEAELEGAEDDTVQKSARAVVCASPATLS